MDVPAVEKGKTSSRGLLQVKGDALSLKPYYEEAGIVIYHGDCREILPTLPKVDLVLTDPPYGIGRSGQGETFTKDVRHKRKHYDDHGWDDSRPDEFVFSKILEVSVNQIIWGGNYFADLLPASKGWLYWDKGQPGLSMSDGELAWTSRKNVLRSFTLNRGEIAQDGAEHPTQKPLKLILWCIGFFPTAQTILDPFMGSGTTLVAAKKLDRKAIGIEINESYCEIAAKRLQNTTPSLFREEA